MSKKTEEDYNEYVISGAASYMDLVKFTRSFWNISAH